MSSLSGRLFARTEALRMGSATRQMAVVIGMIVVAWTWASFAVIDEQIRAQGTVIVSSRSQVIQAVDGGVLKSLKVREGDTVKKGDLLAELDPVRFQASNDEIASKVVSLKANLQRLEAELTDRPLVFSDDVKAYPDIVEVQTSLHQRRKDLQREEQSAIDRSRSLAAQELASLERLAASGDAAQTEVLRARRQVNELQGTLTNKRNGYRQEAQAESAKTRSELEATEQQLAQKREALDATRLFAPMSGIVKNVRVTTIGGVLKGGDELLQIVPSDDPLIIEAKVKSADIGFVRMGLRANVKLDAYDSAIYGSMKGNVIYISPDTLDEPQNQRRDEQPTFRVHIEIKETPKDRAKPIEVIPGMLGSVEIITGERTVAQYLLKPLRRIKSEALVER